MIPHVLSEAADRAALRYDDLAVTLEALFKAALLSPDLGHADQSARLFNDAYAVAEIYFERDKLAMAGDIEKIAAQAHRRALTKIASVDAAGLSDAALAHLGESQTYLSNEIAAQVHRDIANMRHALQKVVLDVGMIERSRRIPSRQAQMIYIIGNEPALSLQFVDRRGRRTPSRTFVRSLYRQVLLSVHNEITLHVIADHGLEHAGLMKIEEGVEQQIGRVSITEYSTVRDQLFHPNSNAFLDVETDDV